MKEKRDMSLVYSKSTGPKTELGKFKSSLRSYKGYDTNTWREKRIPKIVRETYSWFKELPLDEFNFLFDMKGIYETLKGNLQMNKDVQEKLMSGEKLSRDELDHFKLLTDILEKLQKLHHGEKHVTIKADLKDIRDLMFDDSRTDE